MKDRIWLLDSRIIVPEIDIGKVRYLQGSKSRLLGMFRSTVGVSSAAGVGTGVTGGVSVSDDFNRANEDPLAGNWTIVPGTQNLKIVSNTVTTSTDADWAAAYWNANTFNNNQFSQITILSIFRNEAACVRMSTSQNDCYCFLSLAGTYQVAKFTNNVRSQIGSTYGSAVANDVIKIEINGTTITPYINGVPQTTQTDSSYSSGRAGISGFNSGGNALLDNWSGGDL